MWSHCADVVIGVTTFIFILIMNRLIMISVNDLTLLIQQRGQEKINQAGYKHLFYFVCNGTVQYWKDNTYIVLYRSILYKLPRQHFLEPKIGGEQTFSLQEWQSAVSVRQELCHPWKIWDNGYKFMFENPHSCLAFKNWTFQKPSLLKYRKYLSSDSFVPLKTQCRDVFDNLDKFDRYEHDSTGCAIVQWSETTGWNITFQTENLFGDDMNQDARLYAHPTIANEFLGTYNAYIVLKSSRLAQSYATRMVSRRMVLRDDYIYMSEEIPLIYRDERHIEKNCIFHKENVMYSLTFSHGITIQTPSITFHRHSQFLEKLKILWVSKFGQDAPLPLFSFGTPPVAYTEHSSLMVCHFKILYKHACFRSLLPNLDMSEVYAHGNYMYFLFFIEFDNDYNILRTSTPFIPTNDDKTHLPFLLCFATGLSWTHQNELMLMYGEGDVRIKYCLFDTLYLENLLFSLDEYCISRAYMPRLLNVQDLERAPKILYYGYYFQHNMGDDAFVLVLRYLHRCTFSINDNILFHFSNTINPSKSHSFPLLICGGGDVVTPYFMKKLQETPFLRTIGVSIGIPYLADVDYLKTFASAILRNSRDYNSLCHRMSHQIELRTFPDIVFLFHHILQHLPQSLSPYTGPRPVIGINICRTYYTKHSYQYIDFICSLKNTFHMFSQGLGPDTQYAFIPFGTSDIKHHEDDRVLHNHVTSLWQHPNAFDVGTRFPNDGRQSVYHLMNYVRHVDFLVCTRFHAHVCAVLFQVPFVSLSASRKCKEFMSELGLSDLMMPLAVDWSDKPVPIRDPQSVVNFISSRYAERNEIKKRLGRIFHESILPKLEEFLQFYPDFLKSNLLQKSHNEHTYPTCS